MTGEMVSARCEGCGLAYVVDLLEAMTDETVGVCDDCGSPLYVTPSADQAADLTAGLMALATRPTHRCADHVTLIFGGLMPWECVVCGRFLDHVDLGPGPDWEHLRHDRHPVTLAVLAEVMRAYRCRYPDGLNTIGYTPTANGVWVDWIGLADSWLYPTDRAAVAVARGIAAAENAGGWPPRLRQALGKAVAEL